MEASTTTDARQGRDAGMPDDARGVLTAARERRAAADRAEADLLRLAVQWAIIHPAETLDDAESMTSRVHAWGHDESFIPLAGPGAPMVREFCVAEFAAAVGMGTESGKHYLGHALELRYRLPRLWRRVQTGELPGWKARRVAGETISHALSREAAGFVDRHLAPVAHRIGLAQLGRVVDEAVGRYMPEQAEKVRRAAEDRRRFDVETDQISFAGTAEVTGELDLADALDLEDAIRAGAAEMKDLGSTDPLDARRAAAVGELARRQLALHLTEDQQPDRDHADPPDRTPATRPDRTPARRPGRKPARRTVLHLHLSADAIQATATGTGPGRDCGIGRVENTRTPVTAQTIREWCGHPDTHLVVKPVIDLADHVHVEAYEVADRIAEPVALRDLTCVFPHCGKPARRLRPDQHGCDCDHVTPHAKGGVTCSCQIAPLCRHHHRVKTHTPWTYLVLEPGTYLWTTPHGNQFLRNHHGTTDISHDVSPHRPAQPPRP